MHTELHTWYWKNKRPLPWRNSTPWGVVVSEFMLQQTPVNRVLPVWEAWMKKWPTPKHLAKAKKSDVIKHWGRLGYPRRALRLHETSKIITTKYRGSIPKTLPELRELPGVGEYTAAAIYSFAYGKRALVLDTNIRRVFARAIDGKEYASLTLNNKERTKREKLMPREASLWAAATMELGATICTARSPQCEICPIAQSCVWRFKGYPKSRAPKRKTQAWHGTDRQCRGTILNYLREKDRGTRSQFEKLWSDKKQLEKALKSLETDGLIERRAKSFTLAS
ncbi:MAG: A/G-specific adenine glycosylase [Actinobacteria bacterium]|nr:A/G-specific adenine glycosylase [Actinomycetota bacterium]